MWPTYNALFQDIWKKLLVSVLSAPILSLGAFIFSESILTALGSYSADVYANLWYIVLAAVAFALCQGYILWRYASGLIAELCLTLAVCIVYSSYRLDLIALLDDLPLWVFFLVFNIMLFQFAIVLIYISWCIAVGILQKP
jgi:hypothetical protein